MRTITYGILFFTFIIAGSISSIDVPSGGSGFSSLFKLSKEDSLWVESTLSQMTLYEKCAQMIIPYATSFDTSYESEDYQRLVYLVDKLKVGGLIFYQGNVTNQSILTNKLQSLSKIPLLIASDYERGVGMRLEGAVEFPYNMAFGATNDPYLSYLAGKVTAIEGRALGVHQNLAPLLDVNFDYKNPIINIRAYSEDPNIVAWHANAFIKGMHEGNMLTTAKHFPGHGSTDLDSHNELPLISLTEKDLLNRDLIPFIEAIKKGVKSVMTGHLLVPALEGNEEIPATFSQNITSRLLQGELKYDGLIITDAMNMYAIVDNYSVEDAAKLAVQAGNDIILFPVNEEAAINGIYDAIMKGEITEFRINKSVKKILAAKKWLNLDKSRIIDIEYLQKVINNRSHWRLAEEIAARSITLIKDVENIIPVDPREFYSTCLITLSNTVSKSALKDPYVFEKLVEENFNYIRTHRLNLSSKKRDYSKALKNAKKSNLILLSANINVRSFQGSVELDEEQLKLIKQLIKLNKPMVILNLGNPYILSEFPDAGTYLCAYGQSDVSQKCMLDALLGRINITGKLPISIPNTSFQIGYGIMKDSKGLYFQKVDADSNYDFIDVDSLMNNAVRDSIFPGAVLLIGHKGKVIYNKPYGKYTFDEKSQEITTDCIFDLASLTKVVATTSAAMRLYDKDLLNLDNKVAYYLPQFGNKGKEKITVRNILLHNSGLPAFKPYYKRNYQPIEIINDIMNSELKYVPGSQYMYSDLGMIVLQGIIEEISGKRLNEFLEENLFSPLKMERTIFNPPPELWYYCVPTEVDKYWRMKTLKGSVHDETAQLLGGVAGHAGPFSTASDLAILIYTLLNNGKYGDTQIFKSSTVDIWTSKQSKQSSRGLGWDTKSTLRSSAGEKFSINSFGHTGFTGTSIWADKDKDLFVILLTNRIYPTRENHKIKKFRPKIHDAIADAVTYF